MFLRRGKKQLRADTAAFAIRGRISKANARARDGERNLSRHPGGFSKGAHDFMPARVISAAPDADPVLALPHGLVGVGDSAFGVGDVVFDEGEVVADFPECFAFAELGEAVGGSRG